MTLYKELKNILETKSTNAISSKIISIFKNYGFSIDFDSVNFILNNNDSQEKKLYSLVDAAII